MSGDRVNKNADGCGVNQIRDDGTWKNLAENELLAAAAQRAGLDTESTVTALPVGQSLYAYWADNRVLTELLQSDAALDDLSAATW